MGSTIVEFFFFSFFSCFIVTLSARDQKSCQIPLIIRGAWFSWENGQNTLTEINADSMTKRGYCVDMKEEYHVNYTFVFRRDVCYHCVKFIVRTVNILEKLEMSCVNLPSGIDPTVANVCRGLRADQQLITLFSETYVPVNCRSSIEGVWQFAYQNRFRFTGECNNPEAQIRSCQTAGTQFFITNQKFNITYKQCIGMKGTFDGVVEYSCLGDWFVDKNHFFAVANTKESRKDEKYRCFLKNRDDDLYIGASITAECNTLKTVENSPERLRITPVKAEVVEPGCRLPQNMSGNWINTANIDADVFINETHIIETWYPDVGRYRKTIYVCREQRDTRYMMARLTVDGCQKDYVCFDFVPQHHNIIRYRRGLAVIQDNFHTVCSWVQFKNQVEWKYDLFLAKDPVPVRCPVAGKFMFKQKGNVLFETRIIGGVTDTPRPNIYCKQNISDFSVCDTDQKEIAMDETYCLSVDHLGRPVDIYITLSARDQKSCQIPLIIRGTWFSWENGQNTLTEINADSMTKRGYCVDMKEEYHVNYTFVFRRDVCYHCVKFIVRTVNILEKLEMSCVNLPSGIDPTVANVCRGLRADQQLITLFSETYVPVNCRSSIEGVWQFAYQNRFRFTGECNNPEAQIRSCQTAGTQFFITNQKFNITYKQCIGMKGTFDGVVEYSCLGDWFVDKNHFFAVANTKESRKDEKYRCFLKNRDDDLYIGASITAECNTLKTVENSPERLRITPVKAEVVEPGCRLPQNMSGNWINTANIDADVFINETHIIETWYPDVGRYRKTM